MMKQILERLKDNLPLDKGKELVLDFTIVTFKSEFNMLRRKYLLKSDPLLNLQKDIKLDDYFGFMKTLFPDSEVIDHQRGSVAGTPDFEIVSGSEKFYIELKYNGDSVGLNQIKYNHDHEDKIYFLFVSAPHYIYAKDYKPPSTPEPEIFDFDF